MEASYLMEGSPGVRKGAWSKFEDDLLKACVQHYGEGKWHLVPQRAGLNRCRKSCRVRWLNNLRPNIKRGDFSEDEVDLMIKLHKLLGNRWSLIAGRLPGRTSNDVKNYWNTYMRSSKAHSSTHKKEDKNVVILKQDIAETVKPHEVIKPQPRTFSKPILLQGKLFIPFDHTSSKVSSSSKAGAANSSGCSNWWETLLDDNKGDNNHTCSRGDHEALMKDFWDEELNYSITTNNAFDFLTEGQTTWSDFLDQI